MTMTNDSQRRQTSASTTLESQRPVEWQGIHHLALITNDMDATVRFWHGVLGADLVATIGNESFRHYFFKVNSTCSVAFFEYVENEVREFSKPAGVYDKGACQFDHLALNVSGVDELEAIRKRLVDNGCEVTEIIDHKIMKSIYFTDPNGIALEASCWVYDPTEVSPSFDDINYFGDLNPVSAIEELRNGGLTFVPQTRLT